MKYDSKATELWKIGKEQEEQFKAVLNNFKLNKENIEELFKLIRAGEYRRGKEDGIKQCEGEK